MFFDRRLKPQDICAHVNGAEPFFRIHKIDEIHEDFNDEGMVGGREYTPS